MYSQSLEIFVIIFKSMHYRTPILMRHIWLAGRLKSKVLKSNLHFSYFISYCHILKSVHFILAQSGTSIEF